MKRFLMMVALGFVLAFSALSPQAAQASWLEFFFPMLKQKGPTPEETLTAPFADPDAIVDPDAIPSSGLGENSVPLHMRHRANSVITDWVEQTVSDMLVYDAATYTDQYKQKARAFDRAGLAEYVKFLNENNIVSSLKSGSYNVRSFVQDVPIIVNEGEVSGRYRWLYRVRVMVSLVKKDMASYKDANASETVSKEYTLNVHLGRVAEGGDKDLGVLVEGWSGSPVQ